MAKAKAKSAQARTPRMCPTGAIHKMRRDNVEAFDYWMLTDGWHVSLSHQKVGEMPTESISVPRCVFDAFVDWYISGKWKRPRKQL